MVGTHHAGGRLQEVALVLDREPLFGGDVLVRDGFLDVFLVVERRGDDLPGAADRGSDFDVRNVVVGGFILVLGGVVVALDVLDERLLAGESEPVGEVDHAGAVVCEQSEPSVVVTDESHTATDGRTSDKRYLSARTPESGHGWDAPDVCASASTPAAYRWLSVRVSDTSAATSSRKCFRRDSRLHPPGSTPSASIAGSA